MPTDPSTPAASEWAKVAHEHHPGCTAGRCDPDCRYATRDERRLALIELTRKRSETDPTTDEVECIATAIAARRRPSYERWVRTGRKAGDGHFEWTEPGTADDATMETFVAEDGALSMRALTWREVVAEVLGEMRHA